MDDSPPPPLEPSLAPVLLFDCSLGGTEPADHANYGGVARLVYSIPKRQLLPASGTAGFVDDVNWITPQGWALKLDPATRGVSLRDPFTSRTVRLPPDTDSLLASSEDTRCVVSTLQPTDRGFVVLVVHRTDPVICYCRPGGTRWFSLEYQPQLLNDDGDPDSGHRVIENFVSLIAVGDRFFIYLCWLHKLVTLTFSPDPKLSTYCAVVPLPPVPAGCHYAQYRLVESCRELFMVQFYYTLLCNKRTLRFQVQRLDWRRSAWVKETRLGTNRAFFVSLIDQLGASMPADKLGLKANCIYFINTNDKGLYVHDTEQGTATLVDPGPEIPDAMEPILLLPAV